MLKDLLNEYVTQQEALLWYNANITYIWMPSYMYGFVFSHKGIYNIYINKNLCLEKRKKTLLHELAHIELNQLCQIDKDLFAFHIEQYEDEANRYIKEIMKGSECNGK